MLKKLSVILFILFAFSLPIKAQFKESKDRQKMWSKSKKRRKNKEHFNPYLDKKQKPSQDLGKQNARDQKRQQKAARKQKKRSMKKLGIKEVKVKKA